MNIFDCAIKMEEDARGHYEMLAKATTVPELKNIFTLLAGAEKEHYETLKKMRERVDPASAQFASLNDAACAFKKLLDRRQLMEELKDDLDAYQHVVKEEGESIKFYEELAAKAENEETSKLLRMIAEEERRHLSIVENIYAFIEAPKTYLAWGEFSNLRDY